MGGVRGRGQGAGSGGRDGDTAGNLEFSDLRRLALESNLPSQIRKMHFGGIRIYEIRKAGSLMQALPARELISLFGNLILMCVRRLN